MRKIIIFIVAIFASNVAFPQGKTVSIKGSVADESGIPLELATVSLNSSLITCTKSDGSFSIANVPVGTYEYSVSYVGFETLKGTLVVKNGSERIDVNLKELSLALSGVTVTASQEQMGSKSIIDQEAIRHIQPKSMSDLLQLMPGNLVTNPNLNTVANAKIREIGDNVANSLGTAVILDGAPLSNDANLQVMGSAKYGSSWSTDATSAARQTTAGSGADLRTVSAGSIESVEVVSGIPSVEYGNLTSGAVIVKTKSGRTPWEARAQVDERSKLFYLGKGFNLKAGGAMNYSVDWVQSWGDVRRHYLGYDRLTATAGYSRQFGRLSLNVKGSFYSNVNNTKSDRQMDDMDYHYKNSNMGGRLSINGRYQNAKAFLSGIDYNISAQVSKTLDQHDNWVSNPDGVITNSRVAGVREAQFKTVGYHSHYQIDGLPINVFAQLIANKYIPFGKNDFTTLKFGGEYTYDANKGDGFTYDENNPPQYGSAQTLRPRAYKDIPALNTASVFLNDKTEKTFGTIGTQLEVGIRASNLFLDNSKSGGKNSYFVLEPRFNAKVSILNDRNNKFMDDLSITGGYGLFNKMPTLLYLYPDVAYFDNVSLAKYGGNESDRLALMTTDIVSDTKNPDLKPAHSSKWELGLSFAKGPAKGFVTWYHENHRHEFGFASQLYIQSYDVFEVPASAKSPVFSLSTGNVSYVDENGDAKIAGKTRNSEMFHWSLPSNTTHSVKKGLEYGIDLQEWRAIRTSLSINGAWMHVKRVSENTGLQSINYTYGYESVTPEGIGSVSERLNTTFRFITHLPAVKMIFTSTVQIVWYESERMVYEDGSGNSRYHKASWTDGKEYLFVDPVGYYDLTGKLSPWKSDYLNDPTMNVLIPRYQTYAFEKDITSPWVLLGFRFTKELGKTAEISFIANNFTDTKRYHINKYSMTRTLLHPEMYFGAELKIKL
ncbi:MAG: TonB-dependent receptor [Bacteroidales bacterium]|nr:TonB-dependent receptor [Bacteroidales bacterium]MDY6002165.1 TonB-dependent receptor [Candidatus Cryptobacteroides sp.]